MRWQVRVLAIGMVLGQGASGSGETWVRRSQHPRVTSGVSAARLPGGGAVLYGAILGSVPQPPQTWHFADAASRWALVTTTAVPGTRVAQAMAYGGTAAVLFGGAASFSPTATRMGDTWVFEGGDWHQRTPAPAPLPRSGHAMAWGGDDKVVLFGGTDGVAPFHETWVYDVSDDTWTPKATGGPAATGTVGMATLAPGRVLLVRGPAPVETWVYDLALDEWTQLFPAATPPAPNNGLCELGDGEALLFLGAGSGQPSQTWVFRDADTTWTNVTQPAAPGSRLRGALALVGDKALLYGGTGTGLASTILDTWLFDKAQTRWLPLEPAVTPQLASTGDGILAHTSFVTTSTFTFSYEADADLWTCLGAAGPNTGGQLAWAGGDRLVLYKTQGLPIGQTVPQTWSYDRSDNVWTLESPVTSPPRLTGPSLTHVEGGAILFGGYNPATAGQSNDTWVYSSGEWTLRGPAVRPSPRDGAAVAPLGGNRVLLFGGNTGTAGVVPNGETWLYDAALDTWTQLAPAASPSPRSSALMAHVDGDRAVLFGGFDGSYRTDTWSFDLSDGTWTPIPTDLSPTATFYFGAYDRVGQQLVAMAGGEIWTLSLAATPNAPPELDPIGDRGPLWGDLVQFLATASDPDGPAPLTFSLDPGAPAGASIDAATGVFRWTPGIGDIGHHAVTIRVTDAGSPPLDDFETIDVWVTKRQVRFDYTGELSGTCTEVATLSGTLTDHFGGWPLAGKEVGFLLHQQYVTAVTGADGVASTSLRVSAGAGVRLLGSGLWVEDEGYYAGTDLDHFTVLGETSVRAGYSGEHLASGPVGLAAVVEDVDDGSRGDVRDAALGFVSRTAGGAQLCAAGPVSLTNPPDTTAGSAGCVATLAAGVHQVGIEVSRCYARDTPADDTFVTVSDSPAGSVTGAGYLVPTVSGGSHPADSLSRADFGMLVTYAKGGKSPQGSARVLIRSGERVYRASGNAFTSFKVKVTVAGGTAAFTLAGVLEDITDPGAPSVVDPGVSLQITLADNGEPGTADTLGIAVLDAGGQAWFLSRSDKGKLVEEAPAAGSLRVR